MNWIAWTLIGLSVFAALGNIAIIDRPRKPITPAVAVTTVVVQGLYVWAIYWLAVN